MATAPKPQASSTKIKLMGPAQTEYKAFVEQCVNFTSLYWPNWNNYQNPTSYIIPRVFNYKHPDVCDEVFRIADFERIPRAEGADYDATMHRHITDRASDEAEHVVFTALQQLMLDKIRAPWTLVHNLNIQAKEKLISQLFPIVMTEAAFEKCKREYDFLIVGPHIGIIAIEVKSSQYTMGTDFIGTNKSLPMKYLHGLRQLETVEPLFVVLNACAEIDSPHSVPFTKILFTPNLRRERYDLWKEAIGDAARRKVESAVGVAIQWFTEDMDNCAVHSDKPPLYSTLRNILENGTDRPAETMFHFTEKYALLVSGFRSMVLIGGNIELDTIYFSQNKIISREHRRIVGQNPFEGQTKLKVSEHSLLKPIDQSKLKFKPKLYFLSPDQQAVFEGPARQFIIGPAGTGKTVILQAKALQLLSKGEKVIVFSKKHYNVQYEQLFKSCGFENYECLVWTDCLYELIGDDLSEYVENCIYEATKGTYSATEVMGQLYDYVKQESTAEALKWFRGKNIIIDDTCDCDPGSREPIECLSNIFVAWSLMAFVSTVCLQNITWAALDPAIQDFTWLDFVNVPADIFRTTMEGLVRNGLDQAGADLFHVSILRQVMRCSESVYSAAYSGQLQWPEGMEPILAHKIQGLKALSVSEVFDTAREAMIRLRARVQEILLDLLEERVDMANVVVILGSDPDEMDFNFQLTIANDLRSFYLLEKGNRVSVPVYEYHDVSSMEWPLVIYASCIKEHMEDTGSSNYLYKVGYPRYRAMTRATTRLIEITVVYKKAEFSLPFSDSDSEGSIDEYANIYVPFGKSADFFN